MRIIEIDWCAVYHVENCHCVLREIQVVFKALFVSGVF